MVTRLIVIFSIILGLSQAQDPILDFLRGIHPGEVYSNNSVKAKIFEAELAYIIQARERQIAWLPIHSEKIVDEIACLIPEDYKKEKIPAPLSGTSAKNIPSNICIFLHPHTGLHASVGGYRVLDKDGSEKISSVSWSGDYVFKSLYMLTESGIFTEAGMLVAAAAGFWLCGIPKASREYYEADGVKYKSRLGFINHDEFHRMTTVEDFIKKLSTSLDCSLLPLPTRLMNLLKNINLNEQNTNFVFSVVHEIVYEDINRYFVPDDSNVAYSIYKYLFCQDVNPMLFGVESRIFQQCQREVVAQRLMAQQKTSSGSPESLHWTDPQLIELLKGNVITIDVANRIELHPLHVAILAGDLAAFEYFLEKFGPKINPHRGKTPLCLVTEAFSSEGGAPLYRMAQLLLEKGCKAWEVDREFRDYSPLWKATLAKQKKILRLFFSKADKDDLTKYLFIGGEKGIAYYQALNLLNYVSLDNIGYLIKRGVGINQRDSKGRTPLHKAVVRFDSDRVLELLKHTPDLTIGNGLGDTPAVMARKLVWDLREERFPDPTPSYCELIMLQIIGLLGGALERTTN